MAGGLRRGNGGLRYLFAEMAIAACWWFKNDRGQPAFLAWEANGPGQEFQKRVLETDFRDFYYRKQADVVTKRSTNKPGYWTQKQSELLGPYREALMEGQYVNPDAKNRKRRQSSKLRKLKDGSDALAFPRVTRLRRLAYNSFGVGMPRNAQLQDWRVGLVLQNILPLQLSKTNLTCPSISFKLAENGLPAFD